MNDGGREGGRAIAAVVGGVVKATNDLTVFEMLELSKRVVSREGQIYSLLECPLGPRVSARVYFETTRVPTRVNSESTRVPTRVTQGTRVPTRVNSGYSGTYPSVL